MKLWKADLGKALMVLSAIWPPLKRMNVGMLCTWNWQAICWFFVDAELAMRSLPFISSAISSSTGATMRQGPHQGAPEVDQHRGLRVQQCRFRS